VAGVRRRVALAGARKMAGHTQESLAAVLHVDRSTVIRWEAGDQAPLPYLRPKLARLLGQSLEQLRELIKDDSDIQAEESGASPDIEVAFGWLDQHTGWSPGTSRRKVMSRLGNHNRNGQRINVGSR
jgi:DNA-binding XRE family transcriptional regulator